MKEDFGTIVLALIVLLIAIFIFVFVGNNNGGVVDNLSDIDGEYQNVSDKNIYIMLGKSQYEKGRYSVVFIECFDNLGTQYKNYPVQLDGLERNGDVLSYSDSFFKDKELEIVLTDDGFHISNGKAFGYEKFEGTYHMVLKLDEISSDKFRTFN